MLVDDALTSVPVRSNFIQVAEKVSALDEKDALIRERHYQEELNSRTPALSAASLFYLPAVNVQLDTGSISMVMDVLKLSSTFSDADKDWVGPAVS